MRGRIRNPSGEGLTDLSRKTEGDWLYYGASEEDRGEVGEGGSRPYIVPDTTPHEMCPSTHLEMSSQNRRHISCGQEYRVRLSLDLVKPKPYIYPGHLVLKLCTDERQ